MLHRKLLEILSHLTTAERKRLRQFLTSPYFNDGTYADGIVRLFDYIMRYDADERRPSLSKQAVFRVFFPGKPFRENAKTPLDTLASKLFLLVRRFIAQLETERENGELYEHLALSRFYRKFAYEERFWQTMRVLREIQQDNPLRDARYFYDQFRVEESELTFRVLYNSFEDDLNLSAVHKNLDLYYSILKLEFACALEHQRLSAQIDESSPDLLFQTVLNLSIQDGPLDTAVNQVYRVVLNLIQNPGNSDFLREFASVLNQNEPVISSERYRDFRTYQRFFEGQRYQKYGDTFSLRRTFDIYQEHLEKGYFYFDGLIPLTTFRNLVIAGLKLHEFDWVKNFLDTHPPERIGSTRYPAEIHSLNVAEYYFYLKEYEKAEEKLIYRPFENPTFSILADVLMIKIYYETQDELLESRMKALDQKVRRSKLSRETKNRYYNFLKKLDKIIKYGWQKNNPKRARLIEEIKTTPEIATREWLLEKLTGQ